MVSATSRSIVPPTAPDAQRDEARINGNCVLRRNVQTQPYGRCSVCSLPLSGCHAWQSNGYSFAIIVLALASLIVGVPWASALCIAALLAVVVAKGIVDHKRTDVMIDQQHQIARHNAALAEEVERATADLRRSNKALAASSLQLLEADQARLAFLANVTHELRTPLTSIRGAAQNLNDGVVGPLSVRQREYVDIVDGESARLIRVVNDLLQFAKASTAAVELAPADVDLLALARETASQVAHVARDNDIDVTVEGEPVRVSADPDKAKQIVLNLVDNAVKFSSRGGRVTVRVKSADDGGCVEVEDRGDGIPSEDLPHLFERFFRAKTTADRPGTGLGLAIARGLARLHGGDVCATSQAGRGSTFVLTLPRHADAARAATSAASVYGSRDARVRRLLPIVEG